MKSEISFKRLSNQIIETQNQFITKPINSKKKQNWNWKKKFLIANTKTLTVKMNRIKPVSGSNHLHKCLSPSLLRCGRVSLSIWPPAIIICHHNRIVYKQCYWPTLYHIVLCVTIHMEWKLISKLVNITTSEVQYEWITNEVQYEWPRWLLRRSVGNYNTSWIYNW